MSLFLLFCFFISFSFLFSEQTRAESIFLAPPIPYKSEPNSHFESKVLENHRLALESVDMVPILTKSDHVQNLSPQEKNKGLFFIKTYYQKKGNSSYTIYNIIYNIKTGSMIDALHSTNDFTEILGEEFKDIDEKYKEKENELLVRNSKSLIALLNANPQGIENRENLVDHVLSKQISKDLNIKVLEQDNLKTSRDVLKDLEVEVVTASRKAQKISEAPSKVLVFTKEIIEERGYRTLTELLQDVPGFDFNSFHDSGEYPSDMILRGITDVGQSQILIMENGVIQNDIGNGWIRHVQFDTLLIDIERIEIILGPGSSLYGANAYAGIINLITRKGKSFFEDNPSSSSGKVRLQAGKHNTYLSEGLFAYKLPNDMIFQMAGRYYQTKGDLGKGRPDPGNYFSNNREPNSVQTSEFGTIANDKPFFGTTKPLPNGFNNSANNFFIRSSLSKDGLTMGVNFWDVKEGLGSYVPSYEYFTNTKNIPYQKHHRGFFVHGTYETEITRKLNSTSKIYYRNSTILPDTGFVYTYRYQSIDNPISNSGQALPPVWDKAKQYHGPSSLVGAQQQFNYDLLSTNHLVFGVQIDKFTRQSISDGVGGVSLGKKQSVSSNIVESTWETQKPSVATVFYSHTIAGYIQDEQKFWDDKLSFTFGIRNDNDSDYGKIWTKRAAVIVKPNPIYNLKLLYGEAFKAPTVFQIYDEFRGNRELEPQKIKTSEIENSFSFFHNLNLKAGYFMSQLSGLIAEGRNPDVNAPANRSTIFQNFKPTHIYGFNFEIDYNISNFIKLFGNYTITRDRDVKTPFEWFADRNGNITSINPIYDGKEIDNIAERKMNLGVHFSFTKNIFLNLRLNWVGKRKAPITNKYFQPWDIDFINNKYPYQIEGKPDGYMSGYTLVNANFTVKNILNIQGLDIQILGKNLLNTAYAGMGRQSGNAVRPIDQFQTTIRNPEGFVSPYHPQPGRELFLQLGYEF